MIEGLENLDSLFAVFHDGSPVLLAQAGDRFELAIEIEYLAARIRPDYRMFILRLSGISEFSFEPWLPMDQPQLEPIKDPARVFGFDLEILSSKVEADYLVITCDADPDQEDFSGGDLRLRAESALVLDESGREYTLDELIEIARGYWEDFGNRNKASNK